MKTGSIPRRLTIFVREPEKVETNWDDSEEVQKQREVHPCFISDSTNEKTKESGKDWAAGRYWDSKKDLSWSFDIDNKPFFNLEIMGLEIRSEGGRAYKVCADLGDKKNLYFDCREDVLLDCIFEEGIKKGGIIKGPFVFARVGSQMKVIRVGSYLHEEMIRAMEYKKKGKIELEVGGIYKENNKCEHEYVYAGKFYVTSAKTVEDEDRRGRYGYYTKKEKCVGLNKPELKHVFISTISEDIRKYGWYIAKGYICRNGDDERNGEAAFGLEIKKTHSFKECLGKVDIPNDYIEKAKESLIAMAAKYKWEAWEIGDVLSISLDKNYVHPMIQAVIDKLNLKQQ